MSPSSLFADLKTPNGISYQQPTGLFIGGEFVKAKAGKTFETIDPSTEKPIVAIQEADADDAETAVQAAEKAFSSWSQTDPALRGHYLYKIADLLEERADLFAAVESWDNGKTLREAKGDVQQVVAVFRNYAGWADKNFGDLVETDKDHFNYVRREPAGVCGMVIPWNFPLSMLSWKIAPALACGCTCVLKPAETTPLTALLWAELAARAKLPAGVVNVISAAGPVGAVLANHPRIQKVAFTGSTATGRKILEASAKTNLKKVTLELGGKSAHIIFDDANIQRAVKSVMVGVFVNSGQVCSAGTRLLVQDTIHDKFVDALKSEVAKLKAGDPFANDTTYGAQNSKQQFEKVLSYIEQGKADGAKLVTGGKRVGDKGYFIEPTIFSEVKNQDKIAREEIFGPVLSVIRFKDVDDAIAIANDNDYGLAAGIQTEGLNRAIYVANNLKAGTVWVNTYNDFHPQLPFGGYGQSGIGRELGKEVLHNYTQVKTVRIGGIASGQF